MNTMSFEQGPIRPPSEATSLLLRFTRNCPWNKCAFCPIYKKRTFSRRSMAEILADIDAVANILEDLSQVSRTLGYEGEFTRELLQYILSNPDYTEQYKQVTVWACRGDGNVFIQDANSLIMKSDDLVQAFEYLTQRIPQVQRITTYARSSTVARKSLEEMKSLKESGLARIHIGLESGSDNVLKLVNKGTTGQKHILAGQKIVQSGITLSEYIMPGLGGKALSKEHAEQTAYVLNQINPDYIRIRSLHVIPETPLYNMLQEGTFQLLSDDDTAKEIRLMISLLDDIQSTVTSDHIMNLLEEVQGTLPEDKEAMIRVIDDYLSMPEEERILYRLGRRGGALRSIKEIQDPSIRNKLNQAKKELLRQEGKDIEKIITELGSQYI